MAPRTITEGLPTQLPPGIEKRRSPPTLTMDLSSSVKSPLSVISFTARTSLPSFMSRPFHSTENLPLTGFTPAWRPEKSVMSRPSPSSLMSCPSVPSFGAM